MALCKDRDNSKHMSDAQNGSVVTDAGARAPSVKWNKVGDAAFVGKHYFGCVYPNLQHWIKGKFVWQRFALGRDEVNDMGATETLAEAREALASSIRDWFCDAGLAREGGFSS